MYCLRVYSFFTGELIRVERSEKLADDVDVVGDVVVTTAIGDEVAGDATLLGVAIAAAAAAAAAVVAAAAAAVVAGFSCLHISLSRDMCCRYMSCCVCGIVAITMFSTSCCMSGDGNGIPTAGGMIGVAAETAGVIAGECGRRTAAAASIALGVIRRDSAEKTTRLVQSEH